MAQYGNFIPDLAMMKREVLSTGGSLDGVQAGCRGIVAGPGRGSARP
jgi:hypothetical protein